MYCPNCGSQNRPDVNFCENCGAQLRTTSRRPAAPPPAQPIIVQTQGSGGLFSGCAGVFNFILAALVIGLIALIVMVFLCIFKLPSSFPLFDPPRPMADLWSRAVAWQCQNCEEALPAQPAPKQSVPQQSAPQQEAEEKEEPAPAAAVPKDATIIADAGVGSRCSTFDMHFSGYAPNETIDVEIAYYSDESVYHVYDQIQAEADGKVFYPWYADVSKGGQYVIWGRAESAIGSAIFIVEAENEATCACLEAWDAASCESAGGEWRHIYADPGPSFDVCVCPGAGF